MVNVILQGPKWFFGVDAGLGFLSMLIAALVAVMAYKVYKMTREKKYAFFSVSFALLTFSYLSRAWTDVLLQGEMTRLPERLVGTVFFVGYVLHIFSALTAFLLLIFVTYKLQDKRIIALLYLILIPSMLLSGSYFLSFYGLSIIFLSFITYAFYGNYKKVRTKTALLVASAFTLITFSQVAFLLEAIHDLWYVAAQISQFAGYMILLIALIKVVLK
jgi:hypothetical protein